MAKKEIDKKEELRKIPIKNYIIIIVIFIVSISFAMFLRNWYNSYQDYQKTIPVLNGVVSEVRYNEIDNYIVDNQNVIIYIGVATDDNCRKLEKGLKKIIEKRHLKEKIVYFNITDVSDKELLLKEFNDKYALEDKIYTYPAIILIENGKVVDFKSKNASQDLLISDVEQLFDEYEVQGD